MEYGLIGEHLKHSFSKQIHEYIAGYTYEIKEIAKEDLSSFLLKREFKAINVTIPYKESVIPYLDEISEEAKLVGAVNCIVNRNGKLYGYNSDVFGFIELVNHLGLSIKDKNCLILGNGGASKAVEAGLKTLGAKKILKASIKKEEGCLSYEEIKSHKEIEVIVNATPVGMYPNNEDRIISLDDFPSLEGVMDVIYNPIRTNLVLDAQNKGLKAEGGLYMLVAQAVKAIEIFLNKKLDNEILEKTYQKILKEHTNIVLIGMPSSGKTTIGNILKDKTSLPLVDLDEEIIKVIKMPIKDYFALKGEEAFREVESEVIKNIYQQAPLIISTGGGAILKEINVNRLKQNGILYFIKRDLDLLVATDDRPLSNDIEKLRKIYEYRLPIYQKVADKVINNNKEIEEAIKQFEE